MTSGPPRRGRPALAYVPRRMDTPIMDHVLRRAAEARAASVADESSAFMAAWRLSAAAVVLMAGQSVIGVVAPWVYRETGWVTAAWFGNDLVTLLVAVPVLAWSLFAVSRGSQRAALLWFAMLGYAVYNYAYYLFGSALNAFFPLYAALFVLPVFALILGLSQVHVRGIAARFRASTPRRWIAAYMLFTGIGLTFAWTGQWAAYVFGGVVPSIGVEPFQLVAAMDLTFMVPWFVVGAVLLLHGAAWGYIVSSIVVVKGAAYTLVLTTTSTIAALRGVEGSAEQIPIWAAWTLLGALAASGLLGNVRETKAES